MKQIAQYQDGRLELQEVPRPVPPPGGVLVRTTHSVISIGTEKMKVEQAKMNLLQKAKARPDQVRKRTEPAEYVAPTSQTEKTIAEVWGKILGVAKIGSKESFFELGGHSLLAVQAHRELKQALGVEMAITDIFQYPTLGALASHLDDRGQASKVLDKTAARAAARREAMRRRRGR